MMLLDHCSEGRSIESFAAVINSIPEALADWGRRYPEFEVCLRVAYWKSFYFWENLAIEDTKNIKEFKVLDPKLFQTIMKHRFKWRDSSDDLMIMIGKLNDQELEARARRIIDAARPKEVENEHI